MSLRARQTFFIGRRKVERGQLVNDADPIVKGREHLFESTEVPLVEQATAAPGERRAVRIPVATKRYPGARPAKS